MKDVFAMRFFKDYKFSIFFEIILFVSVIVLIFCGISIYINLQSENNAKDKIVRSYLAKAELFISTFAGDIERVASTQDQFVTDMSLLMLCSAPKTMDDFVKYTTLNDLQWSLMCLMASSEYVDDVCLQIPSIERTISIAGIDELNENEYEATQALKKKRDELLVATENDLVIVLSYPETLKKKPQFNLIVSISKEKIAKSMRAFFSESGAGSVLVGNNGVWMVATEDEVGGAVLEQMELAGVDIFSTSSQGLQYIRVGDQRYWTMRYYARDIGASIVEYVPDELMLGQLSTYQYWYLCLTGLSILLLGLYAYWANKRFGSPMKRLLYAFKRVEAGELEYSISHKSNDEFAYLYAQFNSMTQKIEYLVRQVYEQRIMRQQAELKQLQYQINPHFLYNSIYLIYNLASLQDSQSVMRLSEHLGGYYKYITRKSSDRVPLQEEVAHMLDYIQIQSIRFVDRIRAEVEEVPEDCANALVPPLFLQPIVENAYSHGLEHMEYGGLIRVAFSREGNMLLVTVEDSGRGIESIKMSELQQAIDAPIGDSYTTGLINVHRRLRILYGDAGGLSLCQGELGGLRVTVRICVESGVRNG